MVIDPLLYRWIGWLKQQIQGQAVEEGNQEAGTGTRQNESAANPGNPQKVQ